MRWSWRGIGIGYLALLLAGCATPAELAVDRMRQLGFSPSTVTGTKYRHLLARTQHPDDQAIHVYVEHDGLPWQEPQRISRDPTPRYPLALEMMARDQGERVYVARPCYFGLQADAGCSARQWTDARYSDDVIRSMAAVVNRIVDSRAGSARVVLIGYSGGGTIAWLMASHIPATTDVVTIAANLDVGAWTALHGYTPLTGSLDPAAQPPLPLRIRQVHLMAGRDANVPPSIARTVALRQPQAIVVVIPEFDHQCCWLERWPALLQQALGGVPE